MPWIRMPLGFKFQPTDNDLVSGYLLPKSRGENLPADFIRFSGDVYEKPPSEFCTDSTALFGDDNVAKHYFFTDLNRFNQRADRTVGSYGSWHESSKKKIQNNNNEIIGYKKLLNFKLKREGDRDCKVMKTTEWLMHEFSLHLPEIERTDLVLCVIQNKKKDKEKGTGLHLVLGLDSDSGSSSVSGKLKIARVESYSLNSGSQRSFFDNMDLFDGIYIHQKAEAEWGIGGLDHHLADQTVPQSDEEIAEAERGIGGLTHHLAEHKAPQFDEQNAEAERGIGGLDHHLADDTVPQFDEEIAEAERGVGGLDHHLADDTVPQFDKEIAEAERRLGGLDHHLAEHTVPQFDEEIAEAERGIGHFDHHTVPQFDQDTAEELYDHPADDTYPQLLNSTTTANETPCPAQDEETRQSKKRRYGPQFDDDLFSGRSDLIHQLQPSVDTPLHSPIELYMADFNNSVFL